MLGGLFALSVLGLSLSLCTNGNPFAGPSVAAKPIPTLPTDPAEWRGKIDYLALDARLGSMMTDRSMRGLAVAVVEGGRLSFVRGYGVESAESSQPVTAESVFRWASLSKTVSGTLSAQLAADGVISLSDRLETFDTSLRLPGDAQLALTVEELLSQRTGLPKNAFDGRLEDGEDPRTIRLSLADAPTVCAPATCHSYQNIAYDTITEIIAARTGEAYVETVQQRLFRPLGMTSATLGAAGLTSAERWARPHHDQDQLAVSEVYYRVPAAAGVNSNIVDLAVWMQALMGLRPDVLPHAVLETAQRSRVATASPYGRTPMGRELKEAGYGLGIRNFTYKGHKVIGHSGGLSGYRATMMFDPTTRTGIVMLWNSDANLPFRFQAEFMDRAYGLPFTDWLSVARGPHLATAEAPRPPP
ncbi:beta-lactamase family protein [Phenylobacterium sp. LH3H17]|uniref:serine hydrolase domain-containing protein n=1 Tax=Phenylobacterium sp. LH3H17 TaxID=2903901 RepID=UPI0020C99077|nr:serine hydrolase domain-containing protein [Phenylobacterium sp. LH3H17]UTP40516.1 beta-lactamase family protein [Phenylobacterium sp. LH3H17]